jgi:hypothetical protein
LPECSIQKIELFIAFTYSAMSKKTTVERRGGKGGQKTKTPTGEGWRFCFETLVARGGIEPPTQGFSILCSTN